MRFLPKQINSSEGEGVGKGKSLTPAGLTMSTDLKKMPRGKQDAYGEEVFQAKRVTRAKSSKQEPVV